MFSFPEACRGGGIDSGGGDLVESFVFLSNALADSFNEESAWGVGEGGV